MKQGKIVLGTFHKTGTVLIASILRSAAKRLGYRLWIMHKDPEPPEWDVGFHSHSRFSGDVLAKVYRGAIVIRDPRDVIISAAHYHVKSDEKWLLRPQTQFGGQTYQDRIKSMRTIDDRLVFEMNNAAANTIREMTRLSGELNNFKVVKYEALACDVDLTEFESLFRYLGFDEADLPVLKEIATRKSIFGGKVKNGAHIRNGAPEQWKSDFSPAVLAAFVATHGDAAEKLGYAPSDPAALSSKAA